MKKRMLIEQLNDEDFASWIIYKAPEVWRQMSCSFEGFVGWLQSEGEIPMPERKRDKWKEVGIAELNLSARAYNALYGNGITMIDQLLDLREYDLLYMKNCGIVVVEEISEAVYRTTGYRLSK